MPMCLLSLVMWCWKSAGVSPCVQTAGLHGYAQAPAQQLCSSTRATLRRSCRSIEQCAGCSAAELCASCRPMGLRASPSPTALLESSTRATLCRGCSPTHLQQAASARRYTCDLGFRTPCRCVVWAVPWRLHFRDGHQERFQKPWWAYLLLPAVCWPIMRCCLLFPCQQGWTEQLIYGASH